MTAPGRLLCTCRLHCIVLNFNALHSTIVHCVASAALYLPPPLHCTNLHPTSMHCTVHCTLIHCTTLQLLLCTCRLLHCNALCIELYCIALTCILLQFYFNALHYALDLLICTSLHCIPRTMLHFVSQYKEDYCVPRVPQCSVHLHLIFSKFIDTSDLFSCL